MSDIEYGGKKRITELGEQTELAGGEYLVVDHDTNGTRKITPDDLVNGTSLKEDLLALEQEGYPMASIQEAVDAWADEHEAEIVNDYVTPEMYGAIGDGVTDDTTAIQNCINNSSSKVVFQNTSYKVSKINLKSGIIYDFNDAEILFTGEVCMYGTGVSLLETSLSDNYIANSNTFALSSVDGISVGDIITVINETELAHTERNYYYKGGTFKIVKIDNKTVYIDGCLPYPITSTGAIATIYKPFETQIFNIGNISYVGDTLNSTTRAIDIEHGLNCVISGYKSDNEMGGHICITQSVNTKIQDVNCDILHTTDLTNPYVIDVLSSTNTLIDNANISSFWHAITTGYHESCVNTTVLNSTLLNNGVIYAYEDHLNAINTKIIDCVVDGILLAQSGSIIRTITRKKDDGNIAPIRLGGATSHNYSNYIISDCFIIGDDTYNNVYNGISIIGAYYFNDITIRNCKASGIANVYVAASTDINKITIDSCYNVTPYSNLGSYPNEIAIYNCTFIDLTVFSADRCKNLLIENCLFKLTNNVTHNFSISTSNVYPAKIINSNFISESTTYSIRFALRYKITLIGVVCQNASGVAWIVNTNAEITMENASFVCSTFSTASKINGSYINPSDGVVWQFITSGVTKYKGLLDTTDLVVKYTAI